MKSCKNNHNLCPENFTSIWAQINKLQPFLQNYVIQSQLAFCTLYMHGLPGELDTALVTFFFWGGGSMASTLAVMMQLFLLLTCLLRWKSLLLNIKVTSIQVVLSCAL